MYIVILNICFGIYVQLTKFGGFPSGSSTNDHMWQFVHVVLWPIFMLQDFSGFENIAFNILMIFYILMIYPFGVTKKR